MSSQRGWNGQRWDAEAAERFKGLHGRSPVCSCLTHTVLKYPTNEVNKDNCFHASHTDPSHFLPFLLRWLMRWTLWSGKVSTSGFFLRTFADHCICIRLDFLQMCQSRTLSYRQFKHGRNYYSVFSLRFLSERPQTDQEIHEPSGYTPSNVAAATQNKTTGKKSSSVPQQFFFSFL